MNPAQTHLSCTIEACTLSRPYDVAVIDEIQLISDESRGAAWTLCFLGLEVEDLHLCGDPRAFKLICKLAEACGDEVFKYEYKRLSTLKPEESCLASYS